MPPSRSSKTCSTSTPRSGSRAERLFFNHRPWVLVLCLLLTLALGYAALGLKLSASFEKTIPTQHPYIVNLLAHKADLAGQGNALRIAVAVQAGHDLRQGLPGDAAARSATRSSCCRVWTGLS